MLQKLVKRDHVKAIIEMAKKRRRRRPNKTKHRGWEGGCQIRQRERKTTSTTITTTTSPCDSSPSLSLPLSLFLFLFVNSFLFFFLLFWCPSLSLLSLSLSIYLLSVLFAFLLTSGFNRITIMGFEPCFVDNVTIIGTAAWTSVSAPCFFLPVTVKS